MRKLRKGQLVQVICFDHAADGSWLNDEIKAKAEPPILTIMGKVHHQDKDALYLQHFEGKAGEQEESDLDTIVVGAIIEVWELVIKGKKPIRRR